ncbi:hypothetical protein RRF57_000096 [Xylaria bambusicola]|uniref:Uncharacterized protein n=1 Tax=Xylaria bambusicola TaxID=326684 RepID=A0AAN7YTV7_9PEZI
MIQFHILLARKETHATIEQIIAGEIDQRGADLCRGDKKEVDAAPYRFISSLGARERDARKYAAAMPLVPSIVTVGSETSGQKPVFSELIDELV